MRAPAIVALGFFVAGCASPPKAVEGRPKLVPSAPAVSVATLAPASAPARCVAPSKLTLVKTIPRVAHWVGRELWFEQQSNLQVAFEPSTLTRRVVTRGEVEPPRSLAFGFVRGREIRGANSGLTVVDGNRTLYECPTCEISKCGFDGRTSKQPSTGHALHCDTDQEQIEALIALDDPAHPTDRIASLVERTPPSDAYVVSPPRAAGETHFTYRPTFTKAVHTLPIEGEPHEFPTADVAFCGAGELFAVYSADRRYAPTDVSIFRGSDGALLASAAGPAVHANRDEHVESAEFDESGRFLALEVRTMPLGGPDPRASKSSLSFATYVYRLDP